MKRLLLPLLAVLAFPSAVNAESIYLSCEIVSTKHGYDRDWSPLEVGVHDLEIGLDKSRNKAYLLDKRAGMNNKINAVYENYYVSPYTIVIKYRNLMWQTDKAILYSTDTYEIDRISKKIYGIRREFREIKGENILTELVATLERKGTCKRISIKDSKNPFLNP